jgi:hypothetical protein
MPKYCKDAQKVENRDPNRQYLAVLGCSQNMELSVHISNLNSFCTVMCILRILNHTHVELERII